MGYTQAEVERHMKVQKIGTLILEIMIDDSYF